MIIIETRIKSKIILYIIIVILIAITIVGFMCCEHELNNTTELNDEITKEYKKIIDIENNEGGDTNQAVEPVSLGVFKLTAYCSCGICCGKWANNRPLDENGNEIVYGAIGEKLQEGYSIAVDPNVVSYRTEVIINGNTYKAQDCGGGIKGNEIDVYFEDHDKALEFGVQYSEVFVKNK